MSEKKGSKILYPYKVVGLVCGDRRIRMNVLGNDVFFTAPIGKSFQVYEGDKLSVVMASSQLSETINDVELSREFTFTAVNNAIVIWKRFSVQATLQTEYGKIEKLLVIGEYILSASEDGYICIWNWKTTELIRTLNLGREFHPSCMIHPNTYINKILVSSNHGKLQLWNIRSGSLIMEYKGYECGICCLEQSPSVDCVAVGLENGVIDVLNLQYDESVMRFTQSGAVTDVSFHSNLAKSPLLVSGSASGQICIWDVKEQALRFTVEDAHSGPVHTLAFLPNLPLFLSGSADNSLKLWRVDEVDSSPLVLKRREGHTQSSGIIRFYGFNSVVDHASGSNDGMSLNLLSSGQDRAFRTFHVMNDSLAGELSQSHREKKVKSRSVHVEKGQKLPVIVSFAYSEGRDREWANVVTCHYNTSEVYTWEYLHRTLSKHVLRFPTPLFREANYALCCDISNHGELVAVGYRFGDIALYNIQSGLFRGCLPREAKKGFLVKESLYGFISSGEEIEGRGKHTDAILGIFIDILGSKVISVSKDNSVRLWDALNRVLLQTIPLPDGVETCAYSRNTGLLAIATTTHTVQVFDCTAGTLIRRLDGHSNRICTLCFNESGRWLFSADEAGHMRVWDLPNSRLLDWLLFDHPVLSISLSANDEFIATSHQGEIGIHLWTNTSYFKDVLLDQAPTAPVHMDVPSSTLSLPTLPEPALPALATQVEQTAIGHTITLSCDARSKWATLPALELIRERNKPEAPPKAPEKAPFFLPTTAGLTPTFRELAPPPTEKRLLEIPNVLQQESELQRILREAGEHFQQEADQSEVEEEADVESRFGAYYAVLLFFRKQAVAAVDAQLNLLCMNGTDPVGTKALRYLIEFLTVAVDAEVDYEMIQAILRRTIQLYSDILPTLPGVPAMLRAIAAKQEDSWNHLQSLFQQSLCLVDLFSNVQL